MSMNVMLSSTRKERECSDQGELTRQVSSTHQTLPPVDSTKFCSVVLVVMMLYLIVRSKYSQNGVFQKSTTVHCCHKSYTGTALCSCEM